MRVSRIILALFALFALLVGTAHAGTGCPCEKKQACNDCCSVEHDGKTYGPHCRKGVCGSGKFPQDNSKKWSPETQSDSDTEWGNYWECPAGDTTPEHGSDL